MSLTSIVWVIAVVGLMIAGALWAIVFDLDTIVQHVQDCKR